MKLGINIKNKTPHKAAKIPAFSHRDSLLGGTNQQRTNFDVHHYDISVDLDPTTKSIRGSVITSFSFLGTINSSTIQVDLSAQLQVDSITALNRQVSYRRDADALLITLPSAAAKQTITVYYHGVPKIANRPPWEGGMIWKKTETGVDFCGVSCEGDGAQIWLPIKMWLQDEPDSADMTFTVPSPLMVVANGNLLHSETINGKARYHWKTRYPINVYNITFYAADYKLIERDFKSKSGRLLKQQFYVLPSHFEKAKKHFLQTDSVLHAFESAFGPYPWQNEPYKLVESPYEGMEHQTAIAYGNGYKNSGPLKDYIIVHETAHEWWGNALSVADFREVWIHEGFATYSEAVFVEKYYGYKAYLNYLRSQYFTVLNRKPVRGPEGVYYWNYKDGDLYTKGAATLHALRTQLQNDKLFFDILSTFYIGNIGKIVSTDQFIALVNQKSGKDMLIFMPRVEWKMFNHVEFISM